jgi:hypothetical protein
MARSTREKGHGKRLLRFCALMKQIGQPVRRQIRSVCHAGRE